MESPSLHPVAVKKAVKKFAGLTHPQWWWVLTLLSAFAATINVELIRLLSLSGAVVFATYAFHNSEWTGRKWKRTSLAFITFVLVAIGLFKGASYWDDRKAHAPELVTRPEPAPLIVRTRVNVEDYPEGHKISNIEWRPEYADLRVIIENPTDGDYKNMDFIMTPDFPIAESGQISNIPALTIINVSGLEDREISVTVANEKTGKQVYVPLKYLANDVRLLCDRLPKHSRIEIVLAAVQPADLGRGVVPYSSTDISGYGARPKPTKVSIKGTYESQDGMRHTLKQTYQVK